MALEIIDEDISPNVLQDVDEVFSQGEKKFVDVDARRRLEDKIEEMRLRRELREFDFDN